MPFITTKSYCPNCDYPLVIVDEDRYVRITDSSDNTVTACPDCLAELDVENGELVEVKA